MVTGGESISMMGTVACTARALGGRTIGVVPKSLLHHADHSSDELLVTASMSERKATMIARSDALLALPGGVGTCDEIFESWMSRMLVPHAKPLVVLDHHGHFRELVMWVDRMLEAGFINHDWRSALQITEDLTEALDLCAVAADDAVAS